MSAPQHPSEVVHAPPDGRQQRLFDGEGRQLRASAQQFGAAAPGVHSDDSVSVHVGARHVPDWHVRPVQHWVLTVHAVPDG